MILLAVRFKVHPYQMPLVLSNSSIKSRSIRSICDFNINNLWFLFFWSFSTWERGEDSSCPHKKNILLFTTCRRPYLQASFLSLYTLLTFTRLEAAVRCSNFLPFQPPAYGCYLWNETYWGFVGGRQCTALKEVEQSCYWRWNAADLWSYCLLYHGLSHHPSLETIWQLDITIVVWPRNRLLWSLLWHAGIRLLDFDLLRWQYSALNAEDKLCLRKVNFQFKKYSWINTFIFAHYLQWYGDQQKICSLWH